MIRLIIEVVAELIIGLIEIPIIWTGEAALWALTFGRHKPRWDCHAGEGGAFVVLSEMSFWVGAVFIGTVGYLIKLAVFGAD